MVINRKKIFGFCFWSLFLLIIVLSIIPSSSDVLKSDKDYGVRLDYAIHFTIYFLLVVFYALWRVDKQPGRLTTNILLIIIALVYAAANEFLQLYVPSRSFNPVDMIFNIAGVLLGIFVNYFVILRYYHSR